MENIQQLMEQYAELQRVLTNFKEANKEVFTTLEDHQAALNTVENRIKEIARQTKEEYSHSGVAVKVVRAWKKWYEYASLPMRTRELLDNEGVVKHEINKEKFEALVDEGRVKKSEKVKAFKEEELTPRISVGLVKVKEEVKV